MSGYNPYQAPRPAYPPPGSKLGPAPLAQEGRAPSVWPFFAIYCAGMTLLYVFTCLLSIGMIVFASDLASEDPSASPAPAIIGGAVGLVMSIALVGFFASAAFLPRRKWAWIYCIVAIALGLGSPCILPASLPLLIFWLKDDMRSYYGV